MDHKQIKAKIKDLKEKNSLEKDRLESHEADAKMLQRRIHDRKMEIIRLVAELAKHECTKADLDLVGVEEVTFSNGVYALYRCNVCNERYTQWFVVTDRINRDSDGEELFLKDK